MIHYIFLFNKENPVGRRFFSLDIVATGTSVPSNSNVLNRKKETRMVSHKNISTKERYTKALNCAKDTGIWLFRYLNV